MKINKKVQRLFSVALSVALLIATLPVSTLTVNAVTTQFAGGSGTAADPYLIGTKEHLNNVRNDLDAHYKMITDIVFTYADFDENGMYYNSGSGWISIGDQSSWSFVDANDGFTGVFDGNGYSISGISINVNSNKLDYAGLFACNNGTITNLTLRDSVINITSSNHVYAGGITGLNYDGVISNSRAVDCTIKTKSTGASSTAGGIVGFTRTESVIRECYSTSNVYSESSAYAYAGGIIGAGGGNISNCYNAGSVNAKYIGSSSFTTPGAGGVIGSAQSTTITNCYNVGYVSAYTTNGSANVGGICGTVTTPVISNCFYLGNIKVGTGSGDNGTTKCSVDAMKNKVTFEEFDFDSMWTMEGTVDYPYPEFINMSHTGKVQSEEAKDWSDYTPISTKEELNAIRDNLSGKYYLTADIVFSENDFNEGGAFYNEGAGWLPIGTDSSTVFTGILDGNGHKISGLYINRSDESIIYIGLFGYSNGIIRDLILTDCEIFATADTATLDVGGIVGYNYRNGLVTHCSFDGATNAQDYTGGLVGANWGTIEECYNNGNITSTDYAGGIAGLNYETISNCYNSGIIACSSYSYAGGIVGTNSGTVDLCYNIGNIKSTNYKGGICGKNSDIVSLCYYLDTVSLGSGYGADTATKCSASDLQLQQTFAEFDFDFVWTIDSNSKYPFPKLKNVKHETSGDNTTDFAGGTGDVWNPYIITTATHLNNVRNDLNAYYVLGDNIVFAESDFAEGGAFYNGGNGWQPIGTYAAPFAGSFDGKGYSINGLKIASGVEGDTYIGLFGCVDGSATSTIKNVNATNFSINILGDSISTSSSYSDVYVGTIVGYGSAKSCTASGEVRFSYTSNTRKCLVYLGGVVGYGSATNCTNSCDLSADIAAGSAHVSLYIGGIAGRGQNISLCSNYGTLYAYSKRNYNSYIEIGGIAGYAVNVSQSGNSGGITGGGYSNVNHIYVGGIIGRGVDTTTIVEQCYNVAVLKGERGEYTGGIVGYLGNNSRVANSFNAGAVTNGASGGIAGYSSSGTRISNCYNIGYVEEGYGIVYNKYSDATFENCYCLEGVSKNRDYVIVCTEQEMITKDVYRGFDFNTIWQIGNNSRYPWPELQTGSVQNNMIDISDCVVSLVPTKVSYHDVQPEFTVSYNGEVLAINEDYIAFFIVGDKSWRVQTTTKQYIHDVGIGKLLVIGSGDFCYTTTYEFSIEKYDMANASLWTNWVSDGTGGASSSRFSLEDFIYDGTAKVQSGFRVCDTYDTIEDGCFEITYVNNIEPGTATMIITGIGDYYAGKLEKQFTIYSPVVESITITKKPNKLIYNEGDSFDKSGLVVTAHYSNGANAEVTDYTISGYSSTVGTKIITVSHNGKTATFTVTVNSKVPATITSSQYAISGNNISKIAAGTTVSSLISGLNEGSFCKVFKGNSEVSGNTTVGTGMVVKIIDGNTVKASYTTIVTGDTNGDGNITVTDMIAIKAHVLKKSTLSGVYATAADTNGDNGISITDFIQVKAKILGKGTITAR